jgi:hypothetical protein
MSEQSFVPLRCIHKRAHRKLQAAFNTITMATIIILSHEAQNALTANKLLVTKTDSASSQNFHHD